MCIRDRGGTNLLITNPRDMPNFVKELAKYPFTAITGVNTLFNGLLNTPGFESIDFSTLKMSLGGGMAVQRPVAEKWQQVTGTRLLEGYGLTECAPLVTISPYNATAYDGSIGLPAPSTDVKIVREDGTDADLGESGEMRVKGERGDGSEWLIAIEKPVTTERAVQKVVSIGTNAIATSGDYRNYYEEDGKRYSHLIDPNTGSPITHDLVSVTVVNPSSMIADGLATAFNVMGWQRAIDLAEQEQLAVFLIRRTADGFEEYATPEFDKLVEVNN